MRRGFSLIELVIVIALIALLGSLVVINAEGMLRGLGKEPVDRIFQQAVREARYQAASIKEPVFLTYDKDAGMLKILGDNGQNLAEFDMNSDSQSNSTELVFEQILPEMGISGTTTQQTYPIRQIVFRPDRSSTPFQVTIQSKQDAFTVRYDPFSAIVIDDSRNP